MMKRQRKITNPMTVIAIFAAISETSAAVSLPFLDNQDREIYIWFLISFPFYLLLLFFVTLNFNYKSLYAPSDFEKSKHFVQVIDVTSRVQKERHKETSNAQHRKTHPLSSTGAKQQAIEQSDIPTHAQSPPNDIALLVTNATQQILNMPGKLNRIQMIDARQARTKKDLNYLMTATRRQRKTTCGIVVFITNSKSDHAIHKSVLENYKRKDKASRTAYIIYSLRKLTMTVID